jgi:hypothetical protein
VTAYYNDRAIASRGLSEGSAFGQATDGMLGIAPTPCQASAYSRCCGAARIFGVPGGVRFQSRDLHRTPHRPSARQDSASRSGGSECQAGACPWCAPDRSLPSSVGGRETCGQTSRLTRVCTRPSRATCCVALGRLETRFRIGGSCVHRREIDSDSRDGKRLYKRPSNTSDGNVSLAFPCCIARNVVEVTWLNCTTFQREIHEEMGLLQRVGRLRCGMAAELDQGRSHRARRGR